MTTSPLTACAHGYYYDCPNSCDPAHLAADDVAVSAARQYRALRFERRYDAATATAAIARDFGATLAEAGALVGRGVGIIGGSRD